jgi:predicted deacetylase
MSAKYLIRFDDICPTMNWAIWDQIEKALDQHGVSPILAVIPDNQDHSLNIDDPMQYFWDRVRSWQAKGWCIGLHGYKHLYETKCSGVIGLNQRSEFAGLPPEIQYYKIKSALGVFQREGVVANAWIAPAHSFDKFTIHALRELGVSLISDGFFRRIVRDCGLIWAPQQLWRFEPRNSGIWTVCYHHNQWVESDLHRFISGVERYRHSIVSLEDVLVSRVIPNKNIFDAATHHIYLSKLLVFRWLKALSERFTLLRRAISFFRN